MPIEGEAYNIAVLFLLSAIVLLLMVLVELAKHQRVIVVSTEPYGSEDGRV